MVPLTRLVVVTVDPTFVVVSPVKAGKIAAGNVPTVMFVAFVVSVVDDGEGVSPLI